LDSLIYEIIIWLVANLAFGKWKAGYALIEWTCYTKWLIYVWRKVWVNEIVWLIAWETL
jgi:hypothetical protein